MHPSVAPGWDVDRFPPIGETLFPVGVVERSAVRRTRSPIGVSHVFAGVRSTHFDYAWTSAVGQLSGRKKRYGKERDTLS